MNYYLLGHPGWTLFTDHQAIVGIFKKSMMDIDNERILSVREALSPYMITVKHIPGKRNIVADALSRYPVFAEEANNPNTVSKIMRVNAVQNNPILTSLFEKAAEDNQYREVIEEAFHNSDDLKKLSASHPARAIAGKWSEVSAIKKDKGKELLVLDKIISLYLPLLKTTY